MVQRRDFEKLNRRHRAAQAEVAERVGRSARTMQEAARRLHVHDRAAWRRLGGQWVVYMSAEKYASGGIVWIKGQKVRLGRILMTDTAAGYVYAVKDSQSA